MLKIRRPLTALFACTAIATATFANEETLPERKAGLWELKTTMDEGSGPRENAMKLCIDATMEATTVKTSFNEHKANCEKYEVVRSNDATTVDMSCKFNNRHVTGKTEMSGDFKSAFKVRIDSTTSDDAANDTRTVTVHRVITQEGTYVGESCGDLSPGQALTADGQKVLVQ